MIRFDEVVTNDRRPPGAPTIQRRTLESRSEPAVMHRDLANNGFLGHLFKRSTRVQSNRRNFIRSAVAAAGGSVALAASRVGPARAAAAQGTPSGPFGYRVLGGCPSESIYANDQCNPGCSGDIFPGSCGEDGFFRNDEANGYRLRPGDCGVAEQLDGWLWAFAEPCGACPSVVLQCHDGYALLPDFGDVGVWYPGICRTITMCGDTPIFPPQRFDSSAAPQPTSTPTPVPTPTPEPIVQHVGTMISAVDNGNGTATFTGWAKGSDSDSVGFMISVDDAPWHTGFADQPWDTGQPGAGPNHGFSATLGGLEAGSHDFCLHTMVAGEATKLVCANLQIAVSASGTPPPTEVPTPLPTLEPDTTATAAPTVSPTPVPTGGPGEPTPTPTPSPTPTATPTSSPTPVATATPTPTEPTATPVPDESVPEEFGVTGGLEIVRVASDGNAFCSGWAEWLGDGPPGPMNVIITVDGRVTARARASLPRPDRAGGGVPPSVRGFSITSDLVPGRTANVCVFLEAPGSGARFQLGCRSLTGDPLGRLPIEERTARGDETASPIDIEPPVPAAISRVKGNVETIVSPWSGIVLVKGWLYYPDDISESAAFEVFVNGVSDGISFANQNHNRAASSLGIGAQHGFSRVLVAPPGDTLRIEVYPWTGRGRSTLLASSWISV